MRFEFKIFKQFWRFYTHFPSASSGLNHQRHLHQYTHHSKTLHGGGVVQFNPSSPSRQLLPLNASRNPDQSARVRGLMSDLLADIQDCEEQLGTYDPLDA